MIKFCHADDYWTAVQSPTTKTLKKITFINVNTGWMTGDSGAIIKTTNAGDNWLVQDSKITNDIHAHFFLNERIGWALAWEVNFGIDTYPGTIILRTSDGGNNWTNALYADTNYYLSTVYFLDSLRGFLGGIPKFLLYTSDGGLSWSEVGSDSIKTDGYPAKKISFINATTGYAVGGLMDLGGLIWKTTNAGINWRSSPVGPDALTDIFFYGQDTIFLTSGDFKFGATYYRSIDNGQSWTNYNLEYFGIVTALKFRTKKEGWMTIGYQQKFFITTNGGNNWIKFDPPDNSQIFDFSFPDSTHGWAAGVNGKILKYTRLVDIQNEYIENQNFKLYQNYPNPFNPVTEILFSIESKSRIKLTVYDILGKQIAVIAERIYNPGNYKITFDAATQNLPSGIYLYELNTGTQKQIKKMMLLK
ncbi:MAG: YCF48-related protein [bacterium]